MPIQLKTKETISSRLLSGVSFTVRRLGRMQRAGRDLKTLTARRAIQKLVREWRELMDADKRDLSTVELRIARLMELSPDVRLRVDDLDEEMNLLVDENLKPVVIRSALVHVEGLTDEAGLAVDNAEKLLSFGAPGADALIEEIYSACEAASGLSEEERKNLPSPTTSAGPVVGEIPDLAT